MSSPSASRRTDRNSPELRSVVRRHHRAERAANWLTALAAAGAFLAAFVAFSPMPAMGVAVVVATALRVPAFRRSGAVRLRSAAEPEAVVEAFASATPPVLAFQWGIAVEVVPGGSGAGGGSGADSEVDLSPEADTTPETDAGPTATYEISYLLGLRSVSLDLDVDVTRPAESREGTVPADAVAVVDIDATVDGRPWGAYEATIRAAEGAAESQSGDPGTVVDVELRPTRRFGLRRLPQTLVAERYYADALAAQGYEVLDRTVSHSL